MGGWCLWTCCRSVAAGAAVCWWWRVWWFLRLVDGWVVFVDVLHVGGGSGDGSLLVVEGLVVLEAYIVSGHAAGR